MLSRRLLCAVAAVLAVGACGARAENGTYSYAGGSFSTGSAMGQNISVQGVPLAGTTATLSFACPITSYSPGTYSIVWSCAGGTVKIASTDSSLSLTGTFSSGSMTFSGSGGGRGGHTTYYYSFFGTFSGTITTGSVTQAFNGSLSQYVKTGSATGSGAVTAGSLGWDSAYSPVLVADTANQRLLKADNITGVNLGTYGAYGAGVGNFTAIAGLAEDSSGRLYITDSALNRIVRIDNLSGANWSTFGTTGSGVNQFSVPLGITIDSTGKIWVADSGNGRIVRMDDFTGKNWTTFGTLGTGINQFSGPTSIALDSQGRIYVADGGNGRLVRMDDLTGKNWASISQLNIDPYGYPLTGASGVVISPSGRIIVAGADGWVLGMDDITGTNGSVSSWGGAIGSLSQDKAGELFLTGSFTAGVAQAANDLGSGYFTSQFGQQTLQAGAVLALISKSPTPAVPVLTPQKIAFGSQNVGEPSAAQTLKLTNIGSATLTVSSITSAPDFPIGNGCSKPLTGGQSCAISVKFDPSVTSAQSQKLIVNSDGVHPALSATLTGSGTVPSAIVFPLALTFDPQKVTTASTTQVVTLSNPGTGPLTVTSIATTGDFSQTSNCTKILAPRSACTVQVFFKPSVAGTRAGTLTFSDDASPAGTTQTVSLQGTGSTTAAAFTVTPEALFFPDQLVGATSAAQTVTLTNTSTAKAALNAATYPAGFKGSTTCGPTLAAGASCSYKLQFAPTAVGFESTTFNLPISGQSLFKVGLSGDAVAAGSSTVLVANPNPLNFGTQVYGDSIDMSVTLSNTTGVPAGIHGIAFSGTSGLTFTGNNCLTVLAAGASCTLSFNFTGNSSTYSYTGTITILESSGASTLVPVFGYAVSDTGGGN